MAGACPVVCAWRRPRSDPRLAKFATPGNAGSSSRNCSPVDRVVIQRVNDEARQQRVVAGGQASRRIVGATCGQERTPALDRRASGRENLVHCRAIGCPTHPAGKRRAYGSSSIRSISLHTGTCLSDCIGIVGRNAKSATMPLSGVVKVSPAAARSAPAPHIRKNATTLRCLSMSLPLRHSTSWARPRFTKRGSSRMRARPQRSWRPCASCAPTRERHVLTHGDARVSTKFERRASGKPDSKSARKGGSVFRLLT